MARGGVPVAAAVVVAVAAILGLYYRGSSPPIVDRPHPDDAPVSALKSLPKTCTDSSQYITSCAKWAAEGQCDANAGFMMLQCRASCGECEMKRCLRSANMTNAVSDLHSLFQRVSSASSYSPRVLSRDPWLVVLDNFISPALADSVRSATPDGRYARSTDSRYKKDHRTSSSAVGIELWEVPAIQSLEHVAADLMGIPVDHADIQLVRYTTDQYYKVHHDQNRLRDEPSGVRALTLFVYLSDPEDPDAGGETLFPELGLSVAPKKGRAVLWSNVKAEAPDESDPRTFHAGASVRRGVKYGANIWFHAFPFRSFLMKGCPSHQQFVHPHHYNATRWSVRDNILVYGGEFEGTFS
eukprot:TRINITY_DN25524_c0_g1_i1.p1 TRINITY_DN25524_c0_g1~~TRINITY_DN25524_c0_g1_i1.p1  ORF type:complete len:354 (-),score=10.27 TRINITY_DN25524_c0_g1_i1:659-1720(-)